MAWRIDEQVVRGELDCHMKGKVTGKLWLIGRDKPVTLDLTGCPWRDLAGHVLHFKNSSPELKGPEGLAENQTGVVGDITASRKVRVPDGDLDEFIRSKKAGKDWPCHYENILYLEWFSERNGRVVIESTGYELKMEGDAAWSMTPEEEEKQREENGVAMVSFMDKLMDAVQQQHDHELDEDDDAPTSEIEAEADEETARMNKLLDRVDARMNREGTSADDLERIMSEERERLRRERGEPEPEPLTWEQQQEQNERIEEMNEISRQVEEEFEKHPEKFERQPHPLQKACFDLGIRLHHQTRDQGWIPENASPEHPLHAICFGVSSAGAKLAGALDGGPDEEWPPDPLFAGDTLVRLKKARGYLKDALAGLDSADDENLASSEWRSQTRIDIQHILNQTQILIDEVRSSLE